MKTHHFYYLTAFLILALVGTAITFFISEVIIKADESENISKTVVKDTTSVKATVPNEDVATFASGIDISKYQGNLDWNTLNPKIEFVICKATEGRSLVDTEFSSNWANIKKYGRIRGAYHFYISTDDPVTQANFFWKNISSYAHNDLPLVLDIEAESLKGTIDSTALQKDLLSFLKTVEQLSQKTPIVYSNTAFAKEYLNVSAFAAYPLWIAEYTSRTSPRIPSSWKDTSWSFWQRSDTYDLDSIDGDVDFDLFNGNLEKLKDFIEYASQAAE